jgi:coenzyme F420-reducing hydrogenase beta subunit
LLRLEDRRIRFDLKRCCQCGTCIAACHHGALATHLTADGLWTLHWNQDHCDLCGRCAAVCPARLLPHNRLREEDWQRGPVAFLAYAREETIRMEASSGGVARVLLAGSLEKKIVDAAYGLRKSPRYPWAEGSLWRAPANLSDVPSSMYHPIQANKNLRIGRTPAVDSLLLIGTACQLMGAERLLKKRVANLVKVAMLCKQQKTLGATRYYANRLDTRFDTASPHAVSYRGNGWPGRVLINHGSIDWEVAAAVPYGKRLWNVPGCTYCGNPAGGDVDLTLADPWHIEKRNGLGKTLVIAWTEKGLQLIDQHRDELVCEPVTLETVKMSIGWAQIRRRQPLIDYHLGLRVPPRTRFTGLAERLQTTLLEKLFEHTKLPGLLHKVVAHLPDAVNLLPRDRP